MKIPYPKYPQQGDILKNSMIITKKEIIRQKEEENMNKFLNIFLAAPTGIGVVKDGVITEVNPKLLEITGYTQGDLVGKSLQILFLSKEEFTYSGKEEDRQINEAGTVEAKWLKKDGTIIDVLLATNPIYAGDNNKCTVITVYDVTSRKLSESIFKDIIEKNPISIQILNLDGQTIQTNSAHTRLFGATPPMDYSIFNDTQLLEQGLGELFEKIKHGEIVHFPDSYFNPHDVDPSFPDVKGWFMTTGFTLNNSNGVPERIVLMHENISDRKYMEALFQDIIDKNPMSIQIVDNEGYTINGNPSYVRLFGALPPPDFSIFADLEGKSPELGKLILLAKQGNVVHFPDVYYNIRDVFPDFPDNPVWIRALLFPINGSEGKPERFAFMHENITERKLSEQELRKAKEHAEESDRLKSAFLANMSHEIRTPMNSILGFAGLLKKPDLSGEKQKEFIGIIEKSGARLLSTINDIISISKIESGLMQASMLETDVSEHIDYIFNLFKHEAEEKGLVLIVNKYTPLFVVTDSEKLYGILTNLVKNAIKFTNLGSVEFGYKKNKKHLEFFVKDTGDGFPKEKKDLIFERFRQSNESDARNFEGAGLGLSISKAYVEMLGGEIWVESEYGKGSEFYFTIPLDKTNY